MTRATARNRSQRSELRSAVKRVRAATQPVDVSTAYGAAESLLDRAGRKRLIHPNTAAMTRAPLRFASCTAAEPTPPDAPVIRTVSPARRPVRASMFSAAE